MAPESIDVMAESVFTLRQAVELVWVDKGFFHHKFTKEHRIINNNNMKWWERYESSALLSARQREMVDRYSEEGFLSEWFKSEAAYDEIYYNLAEKVTIMCQLLDGDDEDEMRNL